MNSKHRVHPQKIISKDKRSIPCCSKNKMAVKQTTFFNQKRKEYAAHCWNPKNGMMCSTSGTKSHLGGNPSRDLSRTPSRNVCESNPEDVEASSRCGRCAEAEWLSVCWPNDPTAFESELYMSLTAEVPGGRNEKFTGTFHSRVFEGRYGDIIKFVNQTEQSLDANKMIAKKHYIYFPNCPKWGSTDITTSWSYPDLNESRTKNRTSDLVLQDAT